MDFSRKIEKTTMPQGHNHRMPMACLTRPNPARKPHKKTPRACASAMPMLVCSPTCPLNVCTPTCTHPAARHASPAHHLFAQTFDHMPQLSHAYTPERTPVAYLYLPTNICRFPPYIHSSPVGGPTPFIKPLLNSNRTSASAHSSHAINREYS